MQILTRLHLPDLMKSDECALTGAEFHKLSRILRARVGDGFIAFGSGEVERVFEIKTMGADRLEATLIEERAVDVESPVDITLAVGVGKGKKLEETVESVTALGVKRIIPFIAERSVAHRGNPRLADRLRSIAVEACRQSGRTSVPAIEEVIHGLETVLQTVISSEGQLVLADESGGEEIGAVASHLTKNPIVVFIGPEGGWSDSERQFLVAKGALRLSLGPRILRTELAAPVAVALIESCLSGKRGSTLRQGAR